MPGSVFAFPIAAGAMAGGALGALMWPVLALLIGSAWLIKTKGRGVGLILAGVGMLFATLLLHKDFTADRIAELNLYNPAQSSWFDQSIPFEFLEPEQQALSRQAVTAAEFLEGLRDGHFKALQLRTSPSLFTTSNQVFASEIWADQSLLKDAVAELGGRVVLVDQHGGIAGSVAELASSALGLELGFLQGGTNALSQYGWEQLQSELDSNELPAIGYQRWVEQNPDAFLLALTTDHEFVSDGWMFGDRTLTLGDLVANFDSLKQEVGAKAFVAGFETNDIGASAVAINLLKHAGVDTHHVRPDPNEVLVKDPYLKRYQNDDRLLSIDDAKRYMIHRADVAFLDFSEQPWELAGQVAGAYHHIPLSEVAAGRLEERLGALDPAMNYVGLGFDRRTSYHSLIAGAHLAELGAGWLGRFTLPNVMSQELLTNEEFVSPTQSFAYVVKTGLGKAGAAVLDTVVLFILAGIASAAVLIIMIRCRKKYVFAVGSMILYVIFEAFALGLNDYPVNLSRVGSFALLVTGLICVWYLFIKGDDQGSVTPSDNEVTKLPAKAANLKTAEAMGYAVPETVVFSAKRDYLSAPLEMEGKLIVRSAEPSEAREHATTAGIYYSEIVENAKEAKEALLRVFTSFKTQRHASSALVQKFVEADWYGVVQFQENHNTPELVCEYGSHGAVTSGEGEVHRVVIGLNKHGIASAPKPFGKTAEALIDLLKIDAYSLEFALTKDGKLTLLQVNTDKIRACAVRRFIELRDTEFLEVESKHSNPLSAAIIAAMQPGEMVAYGNRRFIRKVSARMMLKNAMSDVNYFGFKSLTSFDQMIAWIDDAVHPNTDMYDLTGTSTSVVDQVVARLRYVANSYGRLNRLATAALQIGKTCRWAQPPRMLLTTQLAEKSAEGSVYKLNGTSPFPMTTFNAYEQTPDFTLEALGTKAIRAPSPAAYVKDAATFMMMYELGAMREALDHIIRSGKESELMAKLGTQVGYWLPSLSCEWGGTPRFESLPLQHLIEGRGTDSLAIRLPAEGVSGPVTTPHATVESGILIIPSCSMSYLPLLESAKAIIAQSGSVTSHLMQHAAAMGKPVVIDPRLTGCFEPGEWLSIDKAGKVLRA
jgi:phosphohistidine swiveling domain-containing protein